MTAYTDDDAAAFIADAVASVGVKGEAAEAMTRLLRATHDWAAARAIREAADDLDDFAGQVKNSPGGTFGGVWAATPVAGIHHAASRLRARAEQVSR